MDNNMSAIHLSKAGFDSRIAKIDTLASEWKFLGERPALIDFFATWCSPCQRLSPIIDELADEYKDKVDIYKVDVDSEQELAALFRIRSIPTLVYIPMSGAPIVEPGGRSKAELKALIEGRLL